MSNSEDSVTYLEEVRSQREGIDSNSEESANNREDLRSYLVVGTESVSKDDSIAYREEYLEVEPISYCILDVLSYLKALEVSKSAPSVLYLEVLDSLL